MPQFFPAQPQPEGPQSIAGLIERVTYFNEETGFSVLKVKVSGFRDLVTVVGTLASANAGEFVNARGNWIVSRDHGRQFQAQELACTAPTTREGIEKYLGSGMIKGIGPVHAKRLVEQFGETIFQVIETASARLEDVEGIGPKRRKIIKAAWGEQKIIREIMVFLHSHGASTSRAVRIYKTYGEAAIEKVQSNPYALARDINGIGFKTADQIAQRLGVLGDSKMRAQAGLDHVLLEAVRQEGHCGLPKEYLLEYTEKLLEPLTRKETIEQALSESLLGKQLVTEVFEKENLIYLPFIRAAEEEIAHRICRWIKDKPIYPDFALEEAIQRCETKQGQILSESQRKALQTVFGNNVVVITGGPGVGKTTLIRTILSILDGLFIKSRVCAPTGRAAKRLQETTGKEAKTIHRLLQPNPKTGGFLHHERNPLEVEVLVVDEMSMVDVRLMSQLLRALPERVSIILVGDKDQLPSVGPGLVLNHLIQSEVVPVVRLTEVFRQASESQIIMQAHAIHQGIMPAARKDKHESDFYFIPREEPGEIMQTLLDLVKRKIPDKFGVDPIEDIQVLSPMNRGSLGVAELNRELQTGLNPLKDNATFVERFGWRYQVGDKIIQTENNYDKEVFNGDIGRIEKISSVDQEILVRFDQREVIYDFNELDEVNLAYAISIHKSQGSEFPVVVIPLATQHYTMLQRNLIYTAVTRGRRLVIVVGQIKAMAMAVRNHRSNHRYSGLLERLKSGLF